MTIRTAQQLRANLESIEKDNTRRLEKLEDRKREIADHAGDTRNIDRELEDAKHAAEASERIAKKQLAAAEARELEQAQAIEATRKAVASEHEHKAKARAQAAYLGAGGDPAGFDSMWPNLREEMLKQEVLKQTQQAQEAVTNIQSL